MQIFPVFFPVTMFPSFFVFVLLLFDHKSTNNPLPVLVPVVAGDVPADVPVFGCFTWERCRKCRGTDPSVILLH